MGQVRYFNFPIQLLENFLVDHKTALERVSAYCLYEYTLNIDEEEYEGGEIHYKMSQALDYFRMTVSNPKAKYKHGKQEYFSVPRNTPHCGLSLKIFWDFYKNHKTDFDKACLLAYLAYRSIVGNKAFCRVTNALLVARMDGKAAVSPQLSKAVSKFATEYQIRKIKNRLKLDWQLVIYGKGTRGCYVTFKLSREDLIYEVEVKKAEYRLKELRREEQAMLDRVKERIKDEQNYRPI